MSATKEGHKKAVKTIKEKYGSDFWKSIGSIGGSRSVTGGFHYDPHKAVTAGRLGGHNSKRGFRLLRKTPKYLIYLKHSTGGIIKFKREKL